MLHYPPHPYIGEAGLARYYEEIAASIPAPVILYARGAPFTERVAHAASAVGDVVAVKYSLPNVAAFGRLAAALPELVWTCGIAEGWAPLFWPAGARGFTSGLANVAPALSLALRDALRAGDADETLRLWHLLLPFEELRARRGDANNVAAVKAALDRLGLPGGPPRPPLSSLPDEDAAELDRILSSWGLR
jgi:4-hydroxy-tetrahydrodipicolinate synthase